MATPAEIASGPCCAATTLGAFPPNTLPLPIFPPPPIPPSAEKFEGGGALAGACCCICCDMRDGAFSCSCIIAAWADDGPFCPGVGSACSASVCSESVCVGGVFTAAADG